MFRTDMDTPSPALYELATVPYCELGQSMSWSPEYAAAWQCRANDPTRLWNTHRSSRFEQDDNTCVCRHLANIASASRTKDWPSVTIVTRRRPFDCVLPLGPER
jgi:hypothetical protein